MPRVVVAIPARNEADRIADCLKALACQQSDVRPRVVVLCNNCTDGTAAVARATAAAMGLMADVSEVELPVPRANAGTARSLAMARAADLAGSDSAGSAGVLLTTDADTRAPADWLAANLRALAGGADAVAGRAVIDAEEARLIPAALHEADARECAYAALVDEVASLLDPDRFDPWPRHDEASGASLAVTLGAYRQVGGVPEVPLGEDRLFVRALYDRDLHVRHDPAVWVTVSGRIEGRAAGGMADTMRRRMSAPDLLVDDRLETVDAAVRRARLRHAARAVHAGTAAPEALATELKLPSLLVAQMLTGPFGEGWVRIEQMAAVLRRRRLAVAELPAQTLAARRIRDLLLRRGRTGPGDSAVAARA